MLRNKWIIGLAALAFTACTHTPNQLLIVHTNDTHSQIEPYKTGFGGYVKLSETIDSLKAIYPNMLLVDAGDFWQGSPYFNIYNGAVEVEAFNRIGYDATTLGNHEFDNGLDALAEQLKKAKFPVINANYDVEETPLKGLIKPYVILDKGGIKVGITGVGVNPHGLIVPDNVKGIIYHDPIETANRYAKLLKHQENCDVVVVLSHLGTMDHDPEIPTDSVLATNSRDIDIIIGGHTHAFKGQFKYVNLNNDTVLVTKTTRSLQELGYCLIEK